MDDIWKGSAATLAGSIRRRELSSTEVVEAFLRRIEEVNPRLNAVVQVRAEPALAEARAADAALVARGDLRPLHGVPFTAKDVFDTADLPSAAGLAERAGFVPERDAVAVARMRAGGAILIGKTNCPPGGGGGITDNPVYGRTNNPYDLDRSPGGSSGGEAAAQAAGLSPVGLGSDSGGSIRVPAHFCGVAGLKPTAGRVPNTGAYDQPGGSVDVRTQIGVLSRFVEDLALVLPLISGPDGRDPGVVPMPHGDPSRVQLDGLRVAWYTEDDATSSSEATERALTIAAEVLAADGLHMTETCPEALGERSLDITRRHWGWEELPGGESVRLLADWDAFRSRMLTFMEDFDAILCPASPDVAPPHDQDVRTMFNATLPFSLTGQPCIVVPAGRTDQGLPVGVQVVTRAWREDVAIAVGLRLESALGGWRPPDL